ncbi:MAG TPA: ABC transporter ATP-binding protein [Thermodesulfobacteriota bacterium]|nr:ABC transporter ATP-binding protein [Thermodesulfobacteriota bacterium]
MASLQVKSVFRYFGGVAALSDVNFRISPGEIVGLIGPNGAGKTTLFNVITGFIKPSKGQILYEDRVISDLAPYEIASLGIIRTYQKTSIFPALTVAQNIAIGHHRQSRSGIWPALFRTQAHHTERQEIEMRIREILDFLAMDWAKDYFAQNLSYGDQRKLEIAVALSARPRLLLLDEPAAGLNPEETNGLMEVIKKIQKQGITILVVEHHMKLVMQVCERIVVLNYGKKIAEGTPVQIQNHEEVVKVYLGEEIEDET